MKQPPTLLTIAVTLLLVGGCANDSECPQGTSRVGGRCTIPSSAEGLVPEVSTGADGEADALTSDALQDDTSTDATTPDGGASDGSAASDGAIQEDTSDSTAPGDATGGDATGESAGVGWLPTPRDTTERDATAVAALGDGATRGIDTSATETDDTGATGGAGNPVTPRGEAAWATARATGGARLSAGSPARPTTSNRLRLTPGETGPPQLAAPLLAVAPPRRHTSSIPNALPAPAFG